MDEVVNAMKILIFILVHDSFLQFLDLAYACGTHKKWHLYFQRPTWKKQLDGMNPKLVQRIGSCILLSKINHPTLVEIVNQ